MRQLRLTTALLAATLAQPVLAQEGAGDLYAEWAGEDGILTLEEWDAGVDAQFGEQAIDLDAAAWDADGDGRITMAEFETGAAETALFGAEAATTEPDEPAPEDMDRVLANQNSDSPITLENVGQLQQIWSAESEHPISHVPLVDGGRVYFSDWGGTVYAADAATGEILWQTEIAED